MSPCYNRPTFILPADAIRARLPDAPPVLASHAADDATRIEVLTAELTARTTDRDSCRESWQWEHGERVKAEAENERLRAEIEAIDTTLTEAGCPACSDRAAGVRWLLRKAENAEADASDLRAAYRVKEKHDDDRVWTAAHALLVLAAKDNPAIGHLAELLRVSR